MSPKILYQKDGNGKDNSQYELPLKCGRSFINALKVRQLQQNQIREMLSKSVDYRLASRLPVSNLEATVSSSAFVICTNTMLIWVRMEVNPEG